MRTAKFDTVRVAEISVNLIENPPVISAKAAFVSTKTGASHGFTNCRTWSPATIELLKQLRDSMQRDLEDTHFDDGSSTSSPTTSGTPMRVPTQGLAEHLEGGDESVPQV